jgi:hypothetical protein
MDTRSTLDVNPSLRSVAAIVSSDMALPAPPQAREVSLPGAAELLHKLSQAETEEDKEAVRKAMVGREDTGQHDI